MKKIFSILTLCLFFSFSLAAEEDFISFSVGLSSGVPFYGSSEITDNLDAFNNQNSRTVVGVLGSINLNIAEPVTFFAGSDFTADFNWDSNARCHILSWDLSSGIKFYPGLEGFNLGLAYVLGYRVDYSGLKTDSPKRTQSAWGNGFKVIMEYNFAHYGSTKFLPSVGVFWKRMPRGNSKFDNQLTAYICANL